MTADQQEASDSNGIWLERGLAAPPEVGEPVGTPFTLGVKANISVNGYRLSAGSPVLGTKPAEYDAPVVATLRQYGAEVVGTTNMHELAFGITSNNAHFGAVLNPRDPSRVAGGSSGGSAAAVASGEVDAALGTDTGGSISIPASLCGVVGFRPTTGRWPTAGTVSLSWTRDTIGSHTRDVATAIQFDRWITGIHGIDHLADDETPRLGLPAGLWADLDQATRDATDRAIERIASVAEVVEVDPSDLLQQLDVAAMPIVLWESHRTLAAAAADALALAPEDAFARLVEGTASEDVRHILSMVLADPIGATTYAESIHLVTDAREKYLAAQKTAMLDGWLFPSTALPAPLLEESHEITHLGTTYSTFNLLTRNTEQGTLLGAPMVTVPVPVEDALPVGLTIQGHRGRDRRTLGIAARLEDALG
ncbi:amidase family protein [Gulosibacter molinativorax]|uniref:amidase family protein n=1 Tax=Gulosibacter molinativorax TaxID=256821 RepID=UPI0004049BE2|nr:amidase family protein [Gulosibacter molinativorax]QUY63052.1 Aspartyl/glutamyl-tRNA(Asn/Gln) amidotransferase subunit A [Gulosibacter molinativorax]